MTHIVIGIDTGGTFTDFIYKAGGQWGILKILSTPQNPGRAVLDGIGRIAGKAGVRVVHGSTVATNAILEKKGAKTAIVTNRGFEDVIEIGRQHRSRLYDLHYTRNDALIPPDLRYGVNGRITAGGEKLEEIDDARLEAVAEELAGAGVESVAVCFLHAFSNPDHEKTADAIFSRKGLSVSPSHAVLSEFREFERMATTVINAYVSPKIRRYIDFMTERIAPENLRIMQSNGGSISAETAGRESVRTILSGPAGGVVGAHDTGRSAGYQRLITFDMGGTSTDVALADKTLPISVESEISGFPVKVPMLDIHTVGAGGGSIAEIDAGGALRVGPESAGADPGPICYGKGERITVTDANLYLGRLVPEFFLGGKMALDTAAMEAHFQEMAKTVGVTPAELARGIIDVANTAMEKAIRVISVEKGHDPKDFTLICFGGAGGLHAAHLAEMLHIGRVLVPQNPGILSAFGMLSADIIKDYSQTVMRSGNDADPQTVQQWMAPLERRAVAELKAEGLPDDRICLQRFLDMRYAGQSYELIVDWTADDPAGFERFHQYHEQRYGYSAPEKPVEIVNVRLRAVGEPEKPVLEESRIGKAEIPDKARAGTRRVAFEGRAMDTPVLRRQYLENGNAIAGPALVVEYSSTIVVPPFASAEIDGFGNIVVYISNLKKR